VGVAPSGHPPTDASFCSGVIDVRKEAGSSRRLRSRARRDVRRRRFGPRGHRVRDRGFNCSRHDRRRPSALRGRRLDLRFRRGRGIRRLVSDGWGSGMMARPAPPRRSSQYAWLITYPLALFALICIIAFWIRHPDWSDDWFLGLIALVFL